MSLADRAREKVKSARAEESKVRKDLQEGFADGAREFVIKQLDLSELDVEEVKAGEREAFVVADGIEFRVTRGSLARFQMQARTVHGGWVEVGSLYRLGLFIEDGTVAP